MSDEHRCKYVIEWRKGSPEERCGQVVHGAMHGWRCPDHGGPPAPEPEVSEEEYIPAEIASYDWDLYVGTGPYETEIPADTPIYVKRSEVEAKQREGGRDA